MVVLGDVFLVIAYLFGVCLSTWALVLGVSLLFPARAARAEAVSERAPGMTFLLGLAVFTVGTVLALGFLAQPLPGAKLLGLILLMAVLSVAVVGLSGLAGLVGQRIQPLEPDISRYKAMSRGAGLLVVAGLLPFVGWFVFAPLLLMFATGAGLQALSGRKKLQPTIDFGTA